MGAHDPEQPSAPTPLRATGAARTAERGGRSSLQPPAELAQPVALGREHHVLDALPPQFPRDVRAALGLDLLEPLADRTSPGVDLEALAGLWVDQREPTD